MLNKILMPSGGQTTDELVILQWEKKVGDFVRRGDILFEIETDKANLTVESFAEGTLLEIRHGDGARVRVGEIVAYIGDPADKLPSADHPEDPLLAHSTAKSDTGNAETTGTVERTMLMKEANKVYASPLAKSRARIENIDLEDVARFVSKKVVKKDDITRYLAHVANGNKAHAQESYFVNVPSMRRTIAKRMKESVSVSPHFIISVDIDMTEVITLRRKLNDSGARIKITYNDIVMKAVAKSVVRHPFINSTFQDDRIQIHKNVNIGLAIAVEGGLVVPVIKNTGQKSLVEIAMANAEMIEQVRSGKIRETDMSGGTITLSNLGMYGMNNFTAIINQPESCILAVGAIIEKPVSIHREMKIRDIMNVTASFDHRVIDGAIGAAFLQELKNTLERPEVLEV